MAEERLQFQKAIQAGVTPFAVTTFRNRERVFGIKLDDRRRHVYVIGKTGMGKTTLIENMVYSDIVAGHGVCYVDPHGDTAEKMLGWIPSSRINDVIYFNPADINFPISFNVLEKVAPEYRHLISSGLIGVFKKQWADSWGPRLEYILRNAILALLEYPDSTLLGINRILVDKVYRKKVVDKIQDPVVRSFWVDEFTKWNDRVLQEVISPIQNKVGQFLSTALIRNIVGQVRSSIDLRKVMDEGKILILNLSKGRIGEDASALLGAMMVTKIQLAAMSRVDIPEDNRNDFYLYVDEFQNFVTDSFANILSEARKYRLNLIIAHQYIEQLGEVVKPAVFGNVGTMICFRLGAEDAEFLENEFAPNLLPEDLVNLPKYQFYTKLMIDGVTSEPFSAKGLPPVYSESLGNEEKAIRASRERYAKPRDVVEDKIRRWSSGGKEASFAKATEAEGGAPRREERGPRPEFRREERPIGTAKEREEGMSKSSTGPKYKAICYNCENEVEVPFKPDNVRPVYCKDCLKKARRGEIKMKSSFVPQSGTTEDTDKLTQPPVSLAEIKKQTVDFRGKPFKEEQKGASSAKASASATSYAKATEVRKASASASSYAKALVDEKATADKSEAAEKKESWKKEIVKPWEIKPSFAKASEGIEKKSTLGIKEKPKEIKQAPEQKPAKPEVKKEEIRKEPEKKEEVRIQKPIIKAEIKTMAKPKEIKKPEPIAKKEETKKEVVSTPKPPQVIKGPEVKIEPSFAKATEGVEKEVVKAAKKVEEEKPSEKIEKKEEVKIEKSKVPIKTKSLEKPKEVVRKPEVKIAKPEEKKEEVKKSKLPAADFLAKEENTQDVQEGETIEL